MEKVFIDILDVEEKVEEIIVEVEFFLEVVFIFVLWSFGIV